MLNPITLMKNTELMQKAAYDMAHKYPSATFPWFAYDIAKEIFIDLDDNIDEEWYKKYEQAITNMKVLAQAELYCLSVKPKWHKRLETKMLQLRDELIQVLKQDYSKNMCHTEKIKAIIPELAKKRTQEDFAKILNKIHDFTAKLESIPQSIYKKNKKKINS